MMPPPCCVHGHAGGGIMRNPLPERVNERLEERMAHSWNGFLMMPPPCCVHGHAGAPACPWTQQGGGIMRNPFQECAIRSSSRSFTRSGSGFLMMPPPACPWTQQGGGIMRNPLPERVNERLEERMAHSWNGVQHTSGYDPEVDQLAALAHRLQSASPLQVRPDFARQLERRLLVRNAERRQQRTAPGWSFPRLFQARPVVGAIMCLCILLLLAGTGTLVAAAQAADPKRPLYTLKRWEQHVQVSLFAPSAESQAELNLQAA